MYYVVRSDVEYKLLLVDTDTYRAEEKTYKELFDLLCSGIKISNIKSDDISLLSSFNWNDYDGLIITKNYSATGWYSIDVDDDYIKSHNLVPVYIDYWSILGNILHSYTSDDFCVAVSQYITRVWFKGNCCDIATPLTLALFLCNDTVYVRYKLSSINAPLFSKRGQAKNVHKCSRIEYMRSVLLE